MAQFKTPEQIAREVCESSNWIQPDDRHEFMDAMTAAIEADRAQRASVQEIVEAWDAYDGSDVAGFFDKWGW